MQNGQTYSDILDFVFTKDDFSLIGQELDLVEESLFKVKKGDLDTVLDSLIREEIAGVMRKLIGQGVLAKDVVAGLRGELAKIKFMEVVLAGDPTLDLTKRMYTFVNEGTSSQRIALDIKVDPLVIGGAKISFEGRFFDGTVAHKLEEVLKNYE